ncbi:diguanylate cyclase domain-containing protein [Desulfolithobacter sp.]
MSNITAQQRQQQVLLAVLSVYRFLIAERDLPSLLQGICDRLVGQGLNLSAWMVLLDDAHGGIITAETGLGDVFAPVMDNLRQGVLPACGLKALDQQGGAAWFCPGTSCENCSLPRRQEAGNAITVPIRCRQNLFGFLVIQTPKGLQVTDEELGLVADLAESIGQALHNLLRLEESRLREKELQRIEERFELALHASDAGLWDWNIKTGEMFTSPCRKGFLDYRESGTSPGSTSWEGLIHPDDKARVLQVLNDHLAGKTEEYRIEYRIRKEDGTWRWFLDCGRVVERDEQGMPVRMTGTHQDITLQKEQAEILVRVQRQLHDAVERERTFLQTVIDGAADSVMVIDMDYTVLLINATAARIMKVDSGEARGKKCYKLFHGSDVPCTDKRYPCPIQAVQESGSRVTLIHNPLHGNNINNTFEIEVTPLRDATGRIRGIIEVARDITDRLRIEKELRESQSKLYQLAHHDILTGLPNRLLFRDRMKQAVAKAQRHKSRVAILFLDLDKFKDINDTLGHDVGDQLLVEVARRLQQQCRRSDTVARFGGDEFVFILDEIKDRNGAAVVAEKILKAMSEPVRVGCHTLHITTSIGIALYPDHSEDMDQVMKYADMALYQAKAEGRNNYRFYDPAMRAPGCSERQDND